MGCDTFLYGHHKTINGYIATKWVVWAFIPLIPVRAYEIIGEGEQEEFTSGSYKSYSRQITYLNYPNFFWPQVIITGVTGWAIAAALIFLLIRFTPPFVT